MVTTERAFFRSTGVPPTSWRQSLPTVPGVGPMQTERPF
jgi:AraC-like DNA-binding protein